MTQIIINKPKQPETGLTVSDIAPGDYFIADDGNLCLKLKKGYVWLAGSGHNYTVSMDATPVERVVSSVEISYAEQD